MTPEQQAAVNEAKSVLRGMSPHIAERRSARALMRLLESVEAAHSSDENNATRMNLAAERVDSVIAPLLAENERLKASVHDLEESVSEAESRANARGRKMVTCCFCGRECESLARLQEHSADCESHPLYAENERLKADLSDSHHWQRRHFEESVADGVQSAEHWKRLQKSEADNVTLRQRVAELEGLLRRAKRSVATVRYNSGHNTGLEDEIDAALKEPSHDAI